MRVSWPWATLNGALALGLCWLAWASGNAVANVIAGVAVLGACLVLLRGR